MGKAPAIQEYTREEHRQELLKKGGESLFFFAKAILGMKDLTEDLHWDLCLALEGRPPYQPWNWMLVCAFRGSLKSSLCSIAYPIQKGLYVPNFATKLVEQKVDNAKVNHFAAISRLFQDSDRADFLYWLYQHRIPEGFKGWNTEQLVFNRTDPLAAPAITYAGLDSGLEGWHGDLIVGDDLEGADANKSDAPNRDARRFVDERMTPLFKDPSTGQGLIAGTPHGDQPLVHWVRETEEQFRTENPGQKIWQIWWKEILDSTGKSRWPERFPDGPKMAALKLKASWIDQYMLQKRSSSERRFDINVVKEHLYEWAARNKMIRYRRQKWETLTLDPTGMPVAEYETTHINPWACRRYLHGDPKHKDRGKQEEESEAGIVVVAVAPDGHVFTLETWAEDAGLERFADQFYYFYRKWNPGVVTLEAIGAQTWFWTYAKTLERGKYRSLHTLGLDGKHPIPLPPLTSRLIEAEKAVTSSKEAWVVSQLESWFSLGILHLHKEQEHLLLQVERFPEKGALKDLLDALSQGPTVWQAPRSPEDLASERQAAYLQSLQNPADPITKYATPWAGGHTVSSTDFLH